MTLDLACILVNWNTCELILEAVKSLRQDLTQSDLKAQIWVVDNASTDGSPEALREAYPDLKLIVSGRNVGFAAGNNLALRSLGFSDSPAPAPEAPRAVFLLNPDTITQRGAVPALFEALFSLPQAGVIGARLDYEDGTFQHSAFAFPGLLQILIDLYPLPPRLHGRLYESRLNGRYPRQQYQSGVPFRVDHTLGAAMLIRREAIEQTGIFDERYFMYVEEVDWCRRIRGAGWEIYVQPQARITHLEGRSTRQARAQSVVNLWRSRFRYFDRYYSGPRRSLARYLVRGGMIFKIRATKRDSNLSEEQRQALIEAYRAVMHL